MKLSFLLAPNQSGGMLPLSLYSVGCHEQNYVLHPNGHSRMQLFWTLTGCGCINLFDGRKLLLKQGEGFYLPRGIPHEYYAMPEEPWMLAFIGIDGPAADSVAAGCGLPACTPFSLRSVQDLWFLLEQLWMDVNSGRPGREPYYSQSIYGILLSAGANLVRMQEREDELEQPDRFGEYTDGGIQQGIPAASNPAEASLQQTLRFMTEHYSEPLSMSNLAGAVGYSVQHFQRIFKRAYGITPHACLQRIRLRHSVDWLLRNPELTVKEVSARLGWESNYYIRVFRSEFGKPPSAYRKAMQQRSVLAPESSPIDVCKNINTNSKNIKNKRKEGDLV